MAHFIPGMFVPFQSETIDLNSVAYRTSVILVEDPGCWDDGEDWENHIENVSRVGLAIDKEHPNMLNLSKIDVFDNATQITNEDLTDKLGLYRIIGDNPIDYGYNITIVDSDKNILAARGEIPPEYGDVVKMKRIVWTHIGSQILMEHGGELEGASSPTKALFYIDKDNVEDVLKGSIALSITNFNFTGDGHTYDGIKLANDVTKEHEPEQGNGFHISGGNTFTDPGGYASLKNSTGSFYHYPGDLTPTPKWDINNETDTLKIFLTKSVFINQSITIDGSEDVYIELQFGNGINVTPDYDPPAGTPFIPISVPDYEPTGLIVEVWQ